MPSKPRRQSQVLAGGTEICSSSGVRSREGAKRLQKVQVSSAVGAFAARWRWHRGAAGAGPPCLLVRLPTGLVPWTGLRSAGCERWMPTGCNKYAPQKTAGLPGTELKKGLTDSIKEG